MVCTPDIAPHVISDLMKRTQFHRGFLRHFFFIKLQQLDHGVFDYLTKGTLRSADFAPFSSVCARCTAHTAHMSAHFIELIIRFEPRHILVPLFRKKTFSSAPAPFAFCLQVANAQVAAQCILLFRFFSISRKLRKSAVRYAPRLWPCIRTCVPVMCTPAHELPPHGSRIKHISCITPT